MRNISIRIVLGFTALSAWFGFLMFHKAGSWSDFPLSDWLIHSALIGGVIFAQVLVLWLLTRSGLNMATVTIYHNVSSDSFALHVIKRLIWVFSWAAALAVIFGGYLYLSGVTVPDLLKRLQSSFVPFFAIMPPLILIHEACLRFWHRLRTLSGNKRHPV